MDLEKAKKYATQMAEIMTKATNELNTPDLIFLLVWLDEGVKVQLQYIEKSIGGIDITDVVERLTKSCRNSANKVAKDLDMI